MSCAIIDYFALRVSPESFFEGADTLHLLARRQALVEGGGRTAPHGRGGRQVRALRGPIPQTPHRLDRRGHRAHRPAAPRGVPGPRRVPPEDERVQDGDKDEIRRQEAKERQDL